MVDLIGVCLAAALAELAGAHEDKGSCGQPLGVGHALGVPAIIAWIRVSTASRET